MKKTDNRSANWLRSYSYLLRYVERKGNARVPSTHIEDGFQLGQWVRTQRTRRERLCEDHIKRLESLPGWVWDMGEVKWERGFDRLWAFVEREGHARVPACHIEERFKLGAWVRSQRARRANLSRERAERLGNLPSWSWDVASDLWDEAYSKLRGFVQREGHARVPSGHVEDHFGLSAWVRAQRAKKEQLSPRKIRALEALPGWYWSAEEDRWNRAFAELLRYVEREGHCRVPVNYRVERLRLGHWVAEQRSKWKNGELPVLRARMLERLPGWSWDASRPTGVSRFRRGLDPFLRYGLDQRAETVYSLLLGYGPLRWDEAVVCAAEALKEGGLVRFEEIHPGDGLWTAVEAAIDKGIALTFFDRPRVGLVRATLVDADDYQAEDWRMCILGALETEAASREHAVEKARNWAVMQLGLELRDERITAGVDEALIDAIDDAIAHKELSVQDGKLIVDESRVAS